MCVTQWQNWEICAKAAKWGYLNCNILYCWTTGAEILFLRSSVTRFSCCHIAQQCVQYQICRELDKWCCITVSLQMMCHLTGSSWIEGMGNCSQGNYFRLLCFCCKFHGTPWQIIMPVYIVIWSNYSNGS